MRRGQFDKSATNSNSGSALQRPGVLAQPLGIIHDLDVFQGGERREALAPPLLRLRFPSVFIYFCTTSLRHVVTHTNPYETATTTSRYSVIVKGTLLGRRCLYTRNSRCHRRSYWCVCGRDLAAQATRLISGQCNPFLGCSGLGAARGLHVGGQPVKIDVDIKDLTPGRLAPPVHVDRDNRLHGWRICLPRKLTIEAYTHTLPHTICPARIATKAAPTWITTSKTSGR